MARPDAYVLECGFGTNPDALLSAQTWTDIVRYLDVKAAITVTRGRGDEFATVQPSTLALTLDNRDGRFTPGNTASPYAPNVISGKRIRLGLLWKGNSKQVYAFDPSFEGTASFGWAVQGGTAIAQSSAQAFHGTKSMQVTLPTAGAFGSNVQSVTINGLVIGRQYTASIYVYVPTGTPVIQWRQIAGGTGSNSSANNAWQRLSVTFVATANNNKMILWPTTASTAGQLFYADAVQVEEGAAATAFEPTAAVFSWRFTGDVAEWPLAWVGGPALYAEVNLKASDRLKKLGDLGDYRTTIDEDILDDSPFAYFPLNEGKGPVSTGSAGDVSGNDEAPLILRQAGTGGAITFGSSPGVPDFYVGKRTTVAINPASAGNGLFLRATLKRNPAPVGANAGSTVSVIAQESVSPLTTGPLAIATGTDGSWFGVWKAPSGNVTAAMYSAAADTIFFVVSGIGMSSSVPSLFTAVLDFPSPGTGRLTFYVNNNGAIGTPVTFALAAVPTWRVVSVGGRASELFRGYLSHAAFYNWPVSSGGIVGWWYSAFKGTDGAGSTSYARINKFCVYSNLETPLQWSGSAFTPQSIGPQEIEGRPLDAIHLVETTENGTFLIRGDGSSYLQLRDFRYNRAAALTVTADRLDPQAVSFRGDDFGLVNEVTATRPDGAAARVVNVPSRDAAGRRRADLSAIPASDEGLRALAAWQANSWGVQRNRVTGLKLSLLNDPALIPSALLLELGTKLAVTTLPSQAPAATQQLFVEGWTEVVGEDEWSMTFTTSPAEVGDVWQIGVAGHNEIGLTTRIPL